MNRRSIGRTGVAVTEIGFGAASIGNLGQAVDDTASAAVARAWGAGIRYFDTAPHYGLGLSERRLGAALATRSRSEFVVSTKVGRLLEPLVRPPRFPIGYGNCCDSGSLAQRSAPSGAAPGTSRQQRSS